MTVQTTSAAHSCPETLLNHKHRLDGSSNKKVREQTCSCVQGYVHKMAIHLSCPAQQSKSSVQLLCEEIIPIVDVPEVLLSNRGPSHRSSNLVL